WRRHRGLAVADLAPSQFRRATGAVIMSTVFLALLPVPGPELSRTIAWLVSVPVLAHFLWDWLSVSGRV
ncbi:CDP-alcohol phosphatidyltransferase family protein, partial [Halorubrum tibetense]